jgi:hypothetical protein
MFEDTGLIAAMGNMLARLLKPLVRLLLKHSFPYSAFEEIAKRVYVEVAMEDSGETGRKPSVSRAAVITGLTRKDVSALLARPWTGLDSDATHYNRAARVVTAWVRDESLRQADGRPRPLSAAEFAELVKRSSGDMPVRAVLDELVRLGSIAEIEEGKLELVDRGFIPSENMLAKVHILGTDGSELLETIIFNIEHGVGTSPRFQRKVMHTGIPLHAIPAFRELSSKKGQAMLELFDSWLAQRDLSAVEQKDWPASARVGVGIYYYEQLSAAAGVEK